MKFVKNIIVGGITYLVAIILLSINMRPCIETMTKKPNEETLQNEESIVKEVEESSTKTTSADNNEKSTVKNNEESIVETTSAENDEESTTKEVKMTATNKTVEKTADEGSTTKEVKTTATNKTVEKTADGEVITINGVKYKAQPRTKITYYCACKKCCGKNARGITASGAKPNAGITVAMPSNIKFGTKIYYNGHVYTCQDRGGAITSNHIDIYCNSHSECYQHSDSGTYQTIYIEVT